MAQDGRLTGFKPTSILCGDGRRVEGVRDGGPGVSPRTETGYPMWEASSGRPPSWTMEDGARRTAAVEVEVV